MIYPREIKCLFCNLQSKDINDFGLCVNCMSLLPYITGLTCSKCGRPLPFDYYENICSSCKSTHIYFDSASCVFEFSGIVQKCIYRLKYDEEKDLASAFGMLLATELKKRNWDIDIIVPVPLHFEKLKERGYNQSWLLASIIGRECSIDASDSVLIRERYTESQTALSASLRLINVKDAFSVKNKKLIRQKSVLLVDDIMTTGATLNECSRILKEGGAEKVYCLAVACPVY